MLSNDRQIYGAGITSLTKGDWKNMATDQRTLHFHAQEAEYILHGDQEPNLRYIEPFFAMLSPQASVLRIPRDLNDVSFGS